MFLFVKPLSVILLIFCAAYINTGYHSPLEKFSDPEYFSKADTAVNARNLTTDIIYNDLKIKKYPTFWGGTISIWEDSTSYGSTTTDLGQEIYKDGQTSILEKLVVPWLLYYTNLYRKEHGLDTLLHDPCLLKSAWYQADYLFNESKKDHRFKLGHYQDSGSQWYKGKDPSDRALAAGCKKYCGENALYKNIVAIPAVDFDNKRKIRLIAQNIARNMVYVQWQNSRSHRENMLTNGYRSMGVSVAIGKHYPEDSYINDKGEKTIILDKNAVNWIAFGIQVMAF
ncbi:MAG: CAP domain-containing protein [Ferruginibacter sp.]